MNTDVRKKLKTDFEKDFFNLKDNEVSGKTMVKVRKYSDVKLVITERRGNYLELETNYHTTKVFNKKTQIVTVADPVFPSYGMLNRLKNV